MTEGGCCGGCGEASSGLSTVVSATRAVWAIGGMSAHSPFVPFFEGSALTSRACKVDLEIEDVRGEITVERALRYSNDDGATWSEPVAWGGGVAGTGWSNAPGYQSISAGARRFQVGLVAVAFQSGLVLGRVRMLVALAEVRSSEVGGGGMPNRFTVWTSDDVIGASDVQYDPSGGRVGFGTAPEAGWRVVVDGDLSIGTGSGAAKIRFASGASGTLQWTPSATRTVTIPNASGTIPLGTGTSGQIPYWSGANTLSDSPLEFPSGTFPTIVRGPRLEATTISTSFALHGECTSTSTSQAAVRADLGITSAGTSAYWMRCRDGANSTRGGVRGDGSGGVQYYSASDAELKEDFRVAEGCLDRVLALPVRDVRWKATGTRSLCFIAQDLWPVFPEATSDPAEKEALNAREVIAFTQVRGGLAREVVEPFGDEDERVALWASLSDDERATARVRPMRADDPCREYLGVDYGRVSTLLAGGLQEHVTATEARLMSLAAEIEALRAEVAALRAEPS